MSILLHGDCLEHMKDMDDESVDFIFCDLPYGATSCAWDCCIDLEKFWIEVMRIKKLRTPIFMTTTTKFGVSLINSCPKKCPFRYDLVWVKSAPAGFLSAKKMPMRKHEMVYVFYEKLPFYDLSSHTHKFLNSKNGVKKDYNLYREDIKQVQNKQYDPPLPVSVVKEPLRKDKHETAYGENIHHHCNQQRNGESIYDPPLPVSVVKEELAEGQTLGDKGNECYGKFSYYNNGVKGYDPPLPVSVVKEELCKYDVNKNTYGGGKEGRIKISKKKEDHQQKYDPPLPTTMLEIKSTRGKHSTEKPVALMEWLLKYYSKEGDVVLDPTMGSGSTGVACKNMNRNFIGIEMDEEIYEIAVNRIED